MSEREPPRPSPEVKALSRFAFFEELDAELSTTEYAPSPRAPAPPPSPAAPALTFEAWVELAVRFAGAPLEDLVAALFTRGLSLPAWTRLDGDYHRALSDDLLAGRTERPAFYAARYQEELARRSGVPSASRVPAPAVEDTPSARPAYEPAPAALRSTAGSPDLPAGTREAMGRMPFVPPPPQPAAPVAPGKRPAKTVQSKVVPTGGLTMGLDADVLQRPTPNLPFVGSTGPAGVLPVKELTALQYLSLRVELMLQVPREVALPRYRIPTEAVYRALEEQWRRPARRVELAHALATLWSALRDQLLG